MRNVGLLILFLLTACKQEQHVPVDVVWQEDDSSYFRAKFPPNYSASSFNMGNEEKIFPGLNLEPASASNKSQVGSLVVFHNSKYAGMMLRDGVGSETKFYEERGGKLLVPARQLPTTNGTCVGFVIADPAKECPTEIKANRCFSMGYAGQCESPFGKRFSVMGILATQTHNVRLEPGAIEMAKTFDRIMATLEFKKF